MKAFLKNVLRSILKMLGVNQVLTGKNKGFKMTYSDTLNLDMLLGLHEPNTFEVFDLFVKPGMVVADVGANIGYFTRFLSQKAGTKGQVHAFEPIPQTFAMLKDTSKLNKLENVTLVNKAVSDKVGSVTMFLSHTHYMASLDSSWAGKEGGETEVPCTTLDAYFETLGKYPDFIKMDIEGGGVYALKGMKNCIAKNAPILMLESHTREEDLAIGEVLSIQGYESYRIGDPTPIEHFDQPYTDPLGVYGTVIAIPTSRKADLGNWSPAQFQKLRLGQRVAHVSAQA